MLKIKKISALVLAVLLIVGVFSACSFSPESKLLGTWRDSTGNVGYEFKENNLCKITYADFTIPVINIPINSSIDGAYTVEKKDDGLYYLTLTYTVIAKSVTETFTFTVDGDVLTLVTPSDGSSRVLLRQAEPTTAATAAAQ